MTDIVHITDPGRVVAIRDPGGVREVFAGHPVVEVVHPGPQGPPGQDGGGSVDALGDVGDVDLDGTGSLLVRSGGSWIDGTLAEAGVAASDHTHVLADVTDSGTLASQDASSVAITGGSIDVETLQVTSTDVALAGHTHTLADVTDSGDLAGQDTVALSTDVSGTLAIGNGGTGVGTALEAFRSLSPLSQPGDLIVMDAVADPDNLGVGTDGQVLTVASGQPAWATLAPADIGAAPSGHTHVLADVTDSGTLAAQDASSVAITGGSIDVETLQVTGTDVALEGHTHAASDVISGTFADALISESSVTQHEGALTIIESQISDLGNYAVVGHTHTLKDVTDSGALAGQDQADLTGDVSGVLPISSGGTGSAAQDLAFNALAPGTTSGDLITTSASQDAQGNPAQSRLPIGSDGQVLTATFSGIASAQWKDLPERDEILFMAYASQSGPLADTNNWETIPFDSSIFQRAGSPISLSGGEITFGQAGTYLVVADVTLDIGDGQDLRTEGQFRLEHDDGTGFSELVGSMGWLYHRLSAQDHTTGSTRYVITASANDKVRVTYKRQGGGSDLNSTSEACRISVTRLGD